MSASPPVTARAERDEPLSAYPAFATTDPDHAHDQAERILNSHRLRLLDPASAFDATVHNAALDGVSLMYFRYGAAVEVTTAPLTDFATVHVPLTGSLVVEHGGVRVAADAARGVILSPDQPLWMRWSTGLRLLVVWISRDVLHRHLGRLVGESLRGPLRFDPSLDLSGSGQALVAAVATARRLLERDDGAGPAPLVRTELSHAIVSALLLGQHHSHTDALVAERPLPSPRVIKRVLDVVDADPSQPLTAATLAEAAGVSVRSLHTAFRRQFGIAPMAYVRQRRLEQAHHELVAADPASGATVTAVALRHGFAHAGRFAAAYRARFGVAPSHMLRQ